VFVCLVNFIILLFALFIAENHVSANAEYIFELTWLHNGMEIGCYLHNECERIISQQDTIYNSEEIWFRKEHRSGYINELQKQGMEKHVAFHYISFELN
jgi:hypothetical protein